MISIASHNLHFTSNKYGMKIPAAGEAIFKERVVSFDECVSVNSQPIYILQGRVTMTTVTYTIIAYLPLESDPSVTIQFPLGGFHLYLKAGGSLLTL